MIDLVLFCFCGESHSLNLSHEYFQVHMSCNRVFHFAHIPMNHFIKLQKTLRVSAKGIPDPSQCLRREFGDFETRQGLTKAREIIHDLVLLAAKQYRLKQRRDIICDFFGKKVQKKLKL